MSTDDMVFRAITRDDGTHGLQVLNAQSHISITEEVLGRRDRKFIDLDGDMLTITADNGTWTYRLGPCDDRGVREGVLV